MTRNYTVHFICLKRSVPDKRMDLLLLRNTIQFLKCQQKKFWEVQVWSNVKQRMSFQVMAHPSFGPQIAPHSYRQSSA